jgi:hypothetical protein
MNTTSNQSPNNGQTLTHKPFQTLPKPTVGKKRIDFDTGYKLVLEIMQRDKLTYSTAAYKVFSVYDVESRVKGIVFASQASFASAVNDKKREDMFGFYKKKGNRKIRSKPMKEEILSKNTLQKRVSRNAISTVAQVKQILDLPIPDDVMIACIRKVLT